MSDYPAAALDAVTNAAAERIRTLEAEAAAWKERAEAAERERDAAVAKRDWWEREWKDLDERRAEEWSVFEQESTDAVNEMRERCAKEAEGPSPNHHSCPIVAAAIRALPIESEET